MISFAEWIDLIGVIAVAVWSWYQQRLHMKHESRIDAMATILENKTYGIKERKVIYDNSELDLKEQRKQQEEKKQEVNTNGAGTGNN